VVATQRPSADVITGMIKANIPSRIAFAVSSQTDSRVILDVNGAETLLGRGDMLFKPLGSSHMERVQGAYVTEEEIALLVNHWRRQAEPEFREELLRRPPDPKDVKKGDDDLFDPDSDDLLADAAQLVIETGSASVSMLQRRLRVGYTRAGRLIDMLERRGIVGPWEGSKPRQILIDPDEAEHVLAVVTPEQVASAEALAFIMNLHRITCGKHIYVILNRAPSSEISDLICNRLEHDIGKILGIPITCLGYVPDEPLMASAAQTRWPFVVMAPESKTSSCLAHVAGAITEICGTHRQNEGSERFLGDLFGSLQNDRPLSLAIQGRRSVREIFPHASQEEVELFRQIILDALDPKKADSLDFVTMYQHVREVVETSKRVNSEVAGFPSPIA